jgi:acyl-ACP--UDP-N-acetylglucosamine O-acyltransferase
VIGLPPQDLKWKPGTPSGVRIGEGTVVREYSTIHRATTPDGFTVLGKDCCLMAQGHIAHDCQIGDNVIMTGYTALTGFVQVGDRAVISGLTGIHQFVRIGTLAMVSGCSRIGQDVPPYFIVEGNTAEVRGVNIVGLRRAGVSATSASTPARVQDSTGPVARRGRRWSKSARTSSRHPRSSTCATSSRRRSAGSARGERWAIASRSGCGPG